jgi:AraC-like DNA-binding protein
MTTLPVVYDWQPRAYFWEGGWIGIARAIGAVPPHSHHAVQIALGIDGPLRFREGDGEWGTYRGAIVLPDVTHSFDGAESTVVMIFVDPESREGRWLRRSLSGAITGLPAERFECCIPGLRIFRDRPLDAMETARLVTSVVRNLCVGPPPVHTLDERVARVLEAIRKSDASRIPLEDVARMVFLSPSRFAHLFAEEVGLPFRRYVLWRKLSRALQTIARGSSLSAAAHTSGFSDSAHLTRTFYQMFGMAPTAMLGKGELYEIPAPFELATSGLPA